ncbi:glypican-5-like [Haliotis rufescens]|uniref:glypican-5-like n=1 Tax=Haliotis rufescens TaxID=6454 RepID=UPI00201F80EC|nr:glypican-5-like [Haliotis rufescens]
MNMVSLCRIISLLCVSVCVIAVALASAPSHRHQGKECGRVQREFSHKKIGSHNLVPDNKVHDSGVSVCFNGKELKHHKSCCTKDTEEKYVKAAERYLKDSLRSTNAYLKKLVMESLARFQERVLDLLEEAQNRTAVMLSRVHNIPWDEHHGTVSDYFLDMEQYARRQHVNLQDSVQTFFTELFPSVFYYILSDPTVIRYDDHYRSCLLQAEEDIQPFGNSPKHLAHKIVQAFQRARAFVNALSVITEAINSTDHIKFDTNCLEAATKLQYCSHCQGYVDAKPCHGFCLNVIGGCLATESEISPAWDDLISAVRTLTNGMKEKFSLEVVLSGIHEQISEGILQAMDDGPRIYTKVLESCKNLNTSVPKDNVKRSYVMSKPKSRRRPAPTSSLMEQLEAVLKKLMDSRGIYNRLSNEICGQGIIYEQDMSSSKCWNGSHIAQYTRIVPESSFIAQAKANPEVKVDVRPNYELLNVKEKLIHMRRNLSTLLTDEQMQGDSPEELVSSGERRIKNENIHINDDEDLYDPSGSGSGDDSDDKDPVAPRPTPPYSHKPKQPKDSGAGLVPVTWSVIALCYCLAQVLYV